MGELENGTKAIKHIMKNYAQLEQSIVSQLRFQADHGTTIGGFREEIWKNMFEQIIPQKFSIARSVFIIDSQGRISSEVDLAIFDEQYTPYIFRHGTLKYIPIEAVAVAIECKSKDPDFEKLSNWLSHIKKLQTSRKSVARMNHDVVFGNESSSPTQTATRPIRILCHTDEGNRTIPDGFDIVIHPKGERLQVEFPSQDIHKLSHWYLALNHAQGEKSEVNWKTDRELSDYRIFRMEGQSKQEVSLLSLTFQLNQMLMLINNPMLFPHIAYVERFNEVGEMGEKERK